MWPPRHQGATKLVCFFSGCVPGVSGMGPTWTSCSGNLLEDGGQTSNKQNTCFCVFRLRSDESRELDSDQRWSAVRACFRGLCDTFANNCLDILEKTRSLPQTDLIFMSIFLVLVPLLHLEKWKKEPLSFSPWRLVSILMARSHFSTTTRRDFCVMVAERRRSDGAFERSMSTFRRWESCRNQEKAWKARQDPTELNHARAAVLLLKQRCGKPDYLTDVENRSFPIILWELPLHLDEFHWRSSAMDFSLACGDSAPALPETRTCARALS